MKITDCERNGDNREPGTEHFPHLDLLFVSPHKTRYKSIIIDVSALNFHNFSI